MTLEEIISYKNHKIKNRVKTIFTVPFSLKALKLDYSEINLDKFLELETLVFNKRTKENILKNRLISKTGCNFYIIEKSNQYVATLFTGPLKLIKEQNELAGIAGVAVHPEYRSKEYSKLLMHMAISDNKKKYPALYYYGQEYLNIFRAIISRLYLIYSSGTNKDQLQCC